MDETPRCVGCKRKIDPYTCHCGDPINTHSGFTGHSPCPMGCVCGFAAPPSMNAEDHVARVAEILSERGKTHAAGNDERERSMENIVDIFRAISGVTLTVEQGWLFMVALKFGRRLGKPKNIDNYHDAMGYLALLAEHQESHS